MGVVPEVSATRSSRAFAASFLICMLLPSLALAAPGVLKDINPTPVGNGSNPSFLGSTGRHMIFTARSPAAAGVALWRTDGTAAGTTTIAGLQPQDASSGFSRGMPTHGRVIFTARDANGVKRLMSTDGTSAGTLVLAPTLVVDLLEPVGTLSDGRAVFGLSLVPMAQELWVSDGTSANTVRLASVAPVSAAYALAGNRLFFVASTGSAFNVWSTDGTQAGTRSATDAHFSTIPRFQGAGTAAVYFTPRYERSVLYRVDAASGIGTSLGMQMQGGGVMELDSGLIIADFPRLWFRDSGTGSLRQLFESPLPWPRSGEHVELIARLGPRVLFSGWSEEAGRELWSTDGTTESTFMVIDRVAGPESSIPTFNGFANGRVVMTAFDPATGRREPWLTDGTAAGTVRIISQPQADTGANALVFTINNAAGSSYWRVHPDTAAARQIVPPFPISSNLDGAPRMGATLFFAASTPEIGNEPAVMDDNGIRFVADLLPQIVTRPSFPDQFVAAGGNVFFMATDEDGNRGPWRTDGTAAGTLRATVPGSPASRSGGHRLIDSGERVFYVHADAEHGAEPWVSDGTPAGTRMLRDIRAGSASSMPDGFPECWDQKWVVNADGYDYFVADDGLRGRELWRTEEAGSATELAVELRSGPTGSQICNLRSWKGHLYFSADAGSGSVFYRSDGTQAGTVPLLALDADDHGPVTHYLEYADRLLFATLAPSGMRIWSTDGSAAGTTRQFTGDFAPFQLTGEINGRLVVGGSLDSRNGIYAFDSLTAAPTFLDEECEPVMAGVTTGKRLFFVSHAGLCVTDGTRAGTYRPRALPQANTMQQPVARDGVVYFVQDEEANRPELWVSDGTDAGTSKATGLLSTYGVAMSANGPVYAIEQEDGDDEPWLWSSPSPLLVEDAITLSSNASGEVDVLANDLPGEGSLLPRLVRIVGTPASGTALVTDAGRIRYQAAPGFAGVVTLQYVATNSLGGTGAPATLAITVTATPPGSGGDIGGEGAGGGGAARITDLLWLMGLWLLSWSALRRKV